MSSSVKYGSAPIRTLHPLIAPYLPYEIQYSRLRESRANMLIMKYSYDYFTVEKKKHC